MAVAREAGVEVVEYLKEKPDRATLARLVAILEDPVEDLVRKDSQLAKLGLDEADYRTPEAIVTLLERYPRLLQRPVLVMGDRAIIGRPKTRVAAFLSG
ncbi:MAG: ArsC/Spx/MgsR family protein [Gaiellales bacterium]